MEVFIGVPEAGLLTNLARALGVTKFRMSDVILITLCCAT